MAKGSIDTFILLQWFTQGLPTSIEAKVFNASNIHFNNDFELDFQELLKKTIRII